MHETGQHVQKNYPTALKWYRKAANHGDPDAQVNTEQQRPTFISQDVSRSFGIFLSQVSVGRLYQEGLGVRTSPFWACRYYKRAALQGHPLGQFYLGLMYEAGQVRRACQNMLQCHCNMHLFSIHSSKISLCFPGRGAKRRKSGRVVSPQRTARSPACPVQPRLHVRPRPRRSA
jgi:TPR repeat protein